MHSSVALPAQNPRARPSEAAYSEADFDGQSPAFTKRNVRKVGARVLAGLAILGVVGTAVTAAHKFGAFKEVARRIGKPSGSPAEDLLTDPLKLVKPRRRWRRG